MMNSETQADIIAEMREYASRCRKENFGIAPESEEHYNEDDVEDLANRLDAAHKRETGNAAEMRNAPESISENLSIHLEHRRGNRVTMPISEAKFYLDYIRTVLSIPGRNCDVGSPEEQSVRMARFCRTQYEKSDVGPLCGSCQFNNMEGIDCQFAWAQMPYEAEGGAE